MPPPRPSRALATLATLAALTGCSCTVDSRPSNPSPSPAASPAANAERQLRAAIIQRFGAPERVSTDIDNSIDLTRAICVVNRENFEVFARQSAEHRTLDDTYVRLDELFRLGVHYLCPQREAELPPIPKGERSDAT